MRELGTFLKVLKTGEMKLVNLMDYLKPRYFKVLVNATNNIAVYYYDKDTFKRPVLSLRWETVLKSVCEAAFFLVAEKEEETNKENEIKTLKKMIESNFRYYVSTNANNDLVFEVCKKGSMLPLTEDVIKLKQYIVSQEEIYAKELQKHPGNTALVRKLTESGEAPLKTLRREDELRVLAIFQLLTPRDKGLVNNIRRITITGEKVDACQ